MKGILADANVEGHFQALLTVLRSAPWVEFWTPLNLVTPRFADLGLASPVQPAGPPVRRGATHHFTTEDPAALLRELEESGRFRRDSRLGAMFHRGKVSMREVSPTHSLHITVGKGNHVSAHVDRYSPLATSQPEHRARYALHRVAAHNLAGIADELARLIPGRRRPCYRPPRQDRSDAA